MWDGAGIPEYFSEYVGLCGSQAMTSIPYYSFIDYEYNSGVFFDGRYSMGPKADTDLMIDIFHYFKRTGTSIMVKSIQ